MTTAEASPSALGPRYAPDDPTLPEPWKGLIDGSTGVLYYWNPETNVTQYEKPASLPPPLPPGPPPTVSTPKLNPIPASRASQPDSIQAPQNQQMMQSQLPQGHQQTQAGPQAAHQQVGPPRQLHGSHLGPTMQQGHLGPEQMRPQLMQQSGQQIPMLQGQQPPYLSMQFMPPFQHGQMYPGPHMGTPHGFQFTPQHSQYMVHQHNKPLQGQENSSQQSQHLLQGQQLPHKQEHKMELGQRDDNEYHQGMQAGFSPAHPHMMQGRQFPHPREQKTGISQRDDVEFQQANQAGGPFMQNLPVGANSSHAQKMSIQPNLTSHYGGSTANNPSVPVQQTGTELTHTQHGSRFQNQMGPGMLQGQHLPPVGSKMPHEENHLGRSGDEYFYNSSKDASAMQPQQPKLAPLPMTRNQQETRIRDFPSQNVTPSLPGRLSGPGGPPLHGAFGHSSGAPPYPNNAFVRPPSAVMGPSDPMHLSAAEIYRQKHEVSATGDDVPAPFMTFEDTGFPPEILQEVRYLLQRGSTCRTLQWYAHIYATTILNF